MGIVYVLTNEAMPGLVKIGMTSDSDANTRIGQLYTTGVPLPFDLKYACRVENHEEVEAALHAAFGPQRFNKKREFFQIQADQAIAILKLLHKADATDEIKKQPTGVDLESLAAVAEVRRRRPHLDFGEMGIPVGAKLDSVTSSGTFVIISGPKKVKLGDEEMSLSAATQNVLGLEYAVRPVPQWKYQGRLLSEIYDETYMPAGE